MFPLSIVRCGQLKQLFLWNGTNDKQIGGEAIACAAQNAQYGPHLMSFEAHNINYQPHLTSHPIGCI